MYMYAQWHTCLCHAPDFFPHSPVLSPLMYVHVCRFTAIACTHTSLAVDGRGFLCCWDWAHTMPHPSTEVGHAHPRAVKLVLGGECVALDRNVLHGHIRYACLTLVLCMYTVYTCTVAVTPSHPTLPLCM